MNLVVCSLGGRKLSSGRLLELAKLSGLPLESQRFPCEYYCY